MTDLKYCVIVCLNNKRKEIKVITKNKPKYGEVFYANLTEEGHLLGKVRPVIVIQNDKANQFSSVVNVIALTSFKGNKRILPTHVLINPSKENGLTNTSIAIVEQIRSITSDKLIGEPIGKIEDKYWSEFRHAISVQIPFLQIKEFCLA